MISFFSFILKPNSGLLVFVWAVEMEKRFAELIFNRRSSPGYCRLFGKITG